MKSKVMNSIRKNSDEAVLYLFGLKIASIASKVHISSQLRSLLRRRVIRYAALHPISSFWHLYFGNMKAKVAWVVMVAIFTMNLIPFFHTTEIAYAGSYLREVEGDVYVYRDGMLYSVNDGYELKSGDRVHTAYDSKATAYFSDTVISRIDGESNITISELGRTDDENIVIGIPKGRLWSKVNADREFSVATKHTFVKANRKSTFDIQASTDSAQVSVVENFVDVELSSYSPSVVKTVVEGESLLVDGRKNKIVALDDEDEWLKSNLSKDLFETKLIAQQEVSQLEDQVGTLPTDPLYQVKTLGEGLNVVLSISEREKLAEQLNVASKRLVEAEVLIRKGLRGSAEKVLKEYKDTMLSLVADYPDLLGIEDVKVKLNKIIARDRSRYNTTLPGSSLYDIKKVVNEVELLLANDRIRANQIAFKQSSDELYQVFELLKVGGETIAKSSIELYSHAFDTTFHDLSMYTQKDHDVYLKSAVDLALVDLKTIQALSEVVESSDMKSEVSLLKDSVVATLNQVVVSHDVVEYAYVIEQMNMILAPNIYVLTKDSEFTGVSDENAEALALPDESVVNEDTLPILEEVKDAPIDVQEEATQSTEVPKTDTF